MDILDTPAFYTLSKWHVSKSKERIFHHYTDDGSPYYSYETRKKKDYFAVRAETLECWNRLISDKSYEEYQKGIDREYNSYGRYPESLKTEEEIKIEKAYYENLFKPSKWIDTKSDPEPIYSKATTPPWEI